MNYSDEDALKEVLKRKKTVTRKRNAKASAYLAGVSAILFAALVSVISLFPQGSSVSGSTASVYGSFLLGRQAGGYVLVSVIAFILGVTVTLVCIRYKNTNDK
ncbi:MAG: hypothetical protein IKN47_02565 [Lachnospiraceae bacterium]|nr:hypothetical protein [Lachnospiraceae bacterium]